MLSLILVLVVTACSPPRDGSEREAPDPVSGMPSEVDLRTADSLVAFWVESGRVPGAVLRVSLAGQVLFEEAYGWARLRDYGGPRPEPVPMTAVTVFDMASVTKVMATTFAVMLLVDRGEMELDAPLHRYLSDFRGDGKDAVTVRHLLTHRAGLAQWQPIYYHASTSREAYAYVRDLPLEWTVGESRHYSDLGFMLLGLAVEAVAGRPLDEFLADELYGPLGMEHTGFRPRTGPFAATSHGNPFERRMVHDPTFGYRIEGDPDAWNGWRHYTLEGEVNDGNAFHAFQGVAGHAGLFSTAADLGVLLELLLEGGGTGGRRFLSTGLVEEFLAPTGDEQALGWQTPGYAPPTSFMHTGFTGTFVLGVRDTGLAVVLLTNRQNGGEDPGGSYPDLSPLHRALTRALTGYTP